MRLFVLLTAFTILYGGLVFKVYSLQVEKGDYYAARAESQNRLAGFLESIRGSIFLTDRNNNLVQAAINKEFPVIVAVPEDIEDPAETASNLSNLFGLNEKKILDLLSKHDDPYEPILRKASEEQVAALKSVNLPGIYVEQERLRFYPFKSLAAQVLGFVGLTADNPVPVGKYGIESQFDSALSGSGGQINGDKIIEAKAGENIVLTLDPNIQTRAEEILGKLVKDYQAAGGTVIVQDPQTGKILALGNYPTFDPNNYSESKLANFLNPAVQLIYEPGSIFKVITMAAGIDSGKITPQTTYIDNGFLTLDGRTIKNWDLKAHGRVTMTEVIEQSINTGAAYAVQRTGKDNFYKYVLDFGFDEPTGIELPGELSGKLNNLKISFRDINFATASFGQGIAITPIQLINAISAIANGGLLKTPHIIADQVDNKVVRRVISPETANQITAMMVSAVDKAGVARIPKYQVAGKTGTAQIPDLKRGGYLDQFIHTYVGFAPASNPRFTILLKLDKPNVTLAGMTVVPAFRELAEFILNYYNVPPDDLNYE